MLSAGRSIISTPYHYARELLADGRGVLVPSRDPTALAEAVDRQLSDPDLLADHARRAAEYGRGMLWPSVARAHVASMRRAQAEQSDARRRVFHARTLAARSTELPSLNLSHLESLTDSTGLLQHAAFGIPRYEDGYCLDDNARALLLMALLDDADATEPRTMRQLTMRYLAFVRHAFNPEAGRFRNFMTYGRTWTEARGSEDSHGRALWALGVVVGKSRQPGWQSLAGQLFHDALPASGEFHSPRGIAFTLLGLDAYQQAFDGDRHVTALQDRLSRKLSDRFDEVAGDGWSWCEDCVSYDNARLPQALILSGHRLQDDVMVGVGLEALSWLTSIQETTDGHFSPIGSNGFYPRGGPKAAFDQQPIEACAMVSACFDAWRITGDDRWAKEMRKAFHWFLGDNVNQTCLYDMASGGCRDSIHADRTNQNQGAESTLSFLLALTDMARFATEIRLQSADALVSTERQRAAQ
ncbi:MAG: hypothetical protein R3B72_10340 [Polyangiaceae bacterium]